MSPEPSRQYRMVLLVALYLAQGLPYGFFTGTLPILLREAGYSLKAISALSLLSLPWALKFLWAPYLDHIGTRRSWLLTFQLASVVGALLLSQADLDNHFTIVLAAAFVFNFIAASQDVVTDGLAVRMLRGGDLAFANGIQVGAYRVGMILGGGGLLLIFARTSWSTMFLCMAGLLALTVLPVFALSEPAAAAKTARARPGRLLIGWVQRLFVPGTLVFMLLIVAFRFGDSMVTSLLGPFLSDQGLSKESIAIMKNTIGSGTSLLGALLGGWFVARVGRRRALLLTGLAQAASFLLYIAAALGIGGVTTLWIATVAEGVVGTMATVALFTLMMDASDPEHAGTDYTIFASVVVLVLTPANFVSAAIADAYGYVAAFVIGTILTAAGTLVLVRRLDARPVSARLQEAWAAR